MCRDRYFCRYFPGQLGYKKSAAGLLQNDHPVSNTKCRRPLSHGTNLIAQEKYSIIFSVVETALKAAPLPPTIFSSWKPLRQWLSTLPTSMLSATATTSVLTAILSASASTATTSTLELAATLTTAATAGTWTSSSGTAAALSPTSWELVTTQPTSALWTTTATPAVAMLSTATALSSI